VTFARKALWFKPEKFGGTGNGSGQHGTQSKRSGRKKCGKGADGMIVISTYTYVCICAADEVRHLQAINTHKLNYSPYRILTFGLHVHSFWAAKSEWEGEWP